MAYYKCPKCNGKGKIVEVDWFAGVLSLGLTALVDLADSPTCNLCKGKGYLKG